MKKLSFAAWAALLVLALTACDQVTATTGSNTNNPAATPSVHGKVTLAVTVGSNPPAGSKILVQLYASKVPVASVKVVGPVASVSVPATSAGDYSYSATGVPDGWYSANVDLVDGSGFSISAGSQSVSGIHVVGGAAAVDPATVTFAGLP